jgi:3-O-methylgallate 3,4-dioxygenase
MAEIVLGAGSSHSPMVSMNGDDWLEWGQRDRKHSGLHTREGRNLTYEDALDLADDSMADRITPAQCVDGAARVEAAVARVREAITAAALDAVVVVGDDQDEHLLSDNLPPFLVYWGDTIANRGMDDIDRLSPMARRYLAGYQETDGAREYPVAVGLARHLIHEALAHDFDVASSDALPDAAHGMGHAFGFVMRRLVAGDVPLVPVMVNTYNPPTQPRATRCAAFGAMLGDAVASFTGCDRVGVIASGGLSHFMVLEDLDREVLAALGRDDLATLTSIPEATFTSGTSEIKNWITVAAMVPHLRFRLLDYVPGYRTPAGSGTGLAFALWAPPPDG